MNIHLINRLLAILAIIGVTVGMVISGCAVSTSRGSSDITEEIMKERIQSLGSDYSQPMKKQSFMEHGKMLGKFFFEKGDKYPEIMLPQKRLKVTDVASGEKGLRSAWLGHSSLLLDMDGVSILTDPVFENKVSIVGPSRFNSEHPLNIESLDSVDVVIISHNHYDHLNKFSVRYLKDKAKLFIVPLGVGEQLRRWGIETSKVIELDWWQSYPVKEDLYITATPGHHFSGRGLFDRNKTLWASWVIKSDNHSVFFSGDSGYFDGFSEIGEKYGPFDVTFLECGAYNESWSNVHMFPEETVRAFMDLKGEVLQPIHWGTYNLALHSWYDPIERVVRAMGSQRERLVIPMMGQVVDYDHPLDFTAWWGAAMKQNVQVAAEPKVVLSSN